MPQIQLLCKNSTKRTQKRCHTQESRALPEHSTKLRRSSVCLGPQETISRLKDTASGCQLSVAQSRQFRQSCSQDTLHIHLASAFGTDSDGSMPCCYSLQASARAGPLCGMCCSAFVEQKQSMASRSDQQSHKKSEELAESPEKLRDCWIMFPCVPAFQAGATWSPARAPGAASAATRREIHLHHGETSRRGDMLMWSFWSQCLLVCDFGGGSGSCPQL